MTQDPGTWHTTGMSKMPFLLPDLDALDPAALKAMICLQHAELISHKSQIEHLELLIAKLRRMQFGRSSEKVERQIEQLELKLEELEANRAEHRSYRRSLLCWIVLRLPGSDGRCPTICLVRSTRTSLKKRAVRPVAVLLRSSAKTSPSCSKTPPPTSSASGICAPGCAFPDLTP